MFIQFFLLHFPPNYYLSSTTFFLDLHSSRSSTFLTHTAAALVSFSIVHNHSFFNVPLPLFSVSVHFHNRSYCFRSLSPHPAPKQPQSVLPHLGHYWRYPILIFYAIILKFITMFNLNLLRKCIARESTDTIFETPSSQYLHAWLNACLLLTIP